MKLHPSSINPFTTQPRFGISPQTVQQHLREEVRRRLGLPEDAPVDVKAYLQSLQAEPNAAAPDTDPAPATEK